MAGAVIGAAGALYATNEEVRRQLPKTARDLPGAVRRRFEAARTAGREASALRRAEILRELESHGGDHAGRRNPGASQEALPAPTPSEIPVTDTVPEKPNVRATEDV